MTGKILFFFDCVSPYSYIGFEALLQYESRLPFKVDYKPVFNGILMKMAQNDAPANSKRKGEQMFRDLPLVSNYWQIPYKNITDFHGRVMSKRSTPALRFLTACRRQQPEQLKLAIRTLFTTLYVDDQDIFEEKDVIEIFNRISFPNRDHLFELMKSPEIKEKLTAHTNEALSYGAFGVPWIVVKQPPKEDVILFGGDRLPILCHLLGTQFDGPLALAKI
ncbi:Glutathione S-transferase kappa [Aphelenchoides besseyi]|nr:Glutathione S-transferase kappa [Aphelenchoides besseyi]